MANKDAKAPDRSEKLQRALGYQPVLERSLNLFANFGIAFCYLSPVVGVYAIFGYGLTTGGPAFFWGLPIVALGQFLVALVFSEIASDFPLSGALYQWAKLLVGPRFGWLVGWIYGCALLTTIAAVDYAAAPYLTQFLNLPTVPSTVLSAALLLMAAHTLFNVFGARTSALVTEIGVWVEVVATVVIAAVLFYHGTTQPLSVLLDTKMTAGNGPYLPLFLAAMLAPIWVFYGFESAGSMAEEAVDASREVPRAILYSLGGSVVVTAFLYLALILCAPSLPQAMKDPSKAIFYIFEAKLGDAMTHVTLALICFAFFSCATAIQAACARLVFAFARDHVIPGAALLGRVSPPHSAPVPALCFTGIVASGTVLLTQLNIGSVNLNALTVSYASLGVYISFQLVVLAYLRAKSKGWRPGGHFRLGGWGTPVAVGALCYGVAMIVNLAWPRPANQVAGWFPLISALIFTSLGLIGVGTLSSRFGAPDGADSVEQAAKEA